VAITIALLMLEEMTVAMGVLVKVVNGGDHLSTRERS
jgi:hypothetical protein